MEFKQLTYFKRVADAGSVSKAAAAMSVAQPAVSRQIANLEEALGTPLFFRNGRGVTLTDAGEQLYAHTAQILDAVRHAEQEVRDSLGVARGRIVIGSMPSVVRIVAPSLLDFVRNTHPELVVEFTAGLSGYVNEWLSNGLLDVAIIHDATRTQHFLTEPLLLEELVVVNAHGDEQPFRQSALADLPLILPRRHHGLRLQVERAVQNERRDLNVLFEVDCMDTIKLLVRAGHASAVLPRSAVMPEEGFSVRPIEPPIHRHLLLATSSQRPVSQSTRAVIHELKRQVRTAVASGAWPGGYREGQRTDKAGQKGDAAVVRIDRAA